MVKYVDAGFEDPAAAAGNKKKKSKKGFKVDRRANYERMIARKYSGKDAKQPVEKRPTRVKSIVFDDAARKDYLLTLHKKKNERRVQAFVDIKKKMRKDNARTRQQQREEARRAYNNYARVPILPNYTFQLPDYVTRQEASEDSDDEDDEEDASSHASGGSNHSDDGAQAEHTPWVYMGGEGEDGGDDEEYEEEEDEEDDDEEERLRLMMAERKRQRKHVTRTHSVHAIPSAMSGAADDDSGDNGAAPHRRTGSSIDDSEVTVEVKPLFGARAALTNAAAAAVEGSGRKASGSSLPSQNFSDLPAVVEQELRKLRQESKGPSRTKSKVHMMKELEKIRKIKKYSRKGHGKKKTSGKRKNRKS